MKSTFLFRLVFVLRLAVISAMLYSPGSAFAAPNPRSGRAPESRTPQLLAATSVGVTFVQVANSANSVGDWTFIDHPLTNGNANAIVFATPNFNPGGGVGTYDDHPIGVWYDTSTSQWAIFNQDSAAMTVNEAFNVLIPPIGSNVFVQTATTSSNRTYIDNPLTNNNPSAILIVTPNWNPGGAGGTSDDHPIGVFYASTLNKWAIFTEDGAVMPVNAAFNVFVAPTGSGAFVQTATTANIASNRTDIDNPLTNNNPYAILFATPSWNSFAVGGGTYDNHNIGVFYDSSDNKMAVFNQDRAAMPVNAVFNVLIAPLNTATFVHQATAANTAWNYTVIDNPLSNGNANAIVMATPNLNPGGGTGVNDVYSIGVWYNTVTNKWSIFNQNGATMPIGAAFNILIFTTDAGELVQKATVANISSNWTEIYYPLTNAHPNAIIFATPNYNPGGVGGVYNSQSIGVWYDGNARWAIFNENGATMPVNAAFNVFVPPVGSNVFVQTATAANTSGDYTDIDNPLTNNNLSVILIVTPNWNPGGSGGTYDHDNIGIEYNTGTNKWAIFNRSGNAMPLGAAFNVYVTSNRLMLPLIKRSAKVKSRVRPLIWSSFQTNKGLSPRGRSLTKARSLTGTLWSSHGAACQKG